MRHARQQPNSRSLLNGDEVAHRATESRKSDAGTERILDLQRLAGNRATSEVVQRLDEEDEETLLEAARFAANPFLYAAKKAGTWSGGKIKELSGQNDQEGAGGQDHAGGGGLEDVIGGTDFGGGGLEDVIGGTDFGGGGSDHVIGGGGPGSGGHGASSGVEKDEPVGSDPLVGLRPGDGLDVGTWQRRPRVKLLQYRLNEVAGAGLKVDGMWGKRTTAGLEAFQLARTMVPMTPLDAATTSALLGAAPGSAEAPGGAAGEGPAAAGGEAPALPDISSLVPRDTMTRWESPLIVTPSSLVESGPGRLPDRAGGGAGGGGAGFGIATSSGLIGAPAGGGMSAAFGGPDDDYLARLHKYGPVLTDMWHRFERASDDTQAFFNLVGQSADAAAYWASRAFTSICASLAGIVLGPPGVALWTLANQFWGLGAKMADAAERPILEAAAWPALDALGKFRDVVVASYANAYPMRTPDMPWYVTGAGWIQGPTSTLIHAYGQVQQLRKR